MGRSRMVATVLATLLGLFGAGLAGCGSTTSSRPPASTKSSGSPPQHPLVVFAAASLKPTFSKLADRFASDNPGATVDFNFGGSSDLATQLIQGATADVFASADTVQMNKAEKSGLLAGRPVNFASNTLVIVTAPGNPKHVESFADLAMPGLHVVVCQQPVPCGAAANSIEGAAGVHLNPVSEEPNVSDVLNKVTTGQADAGLVYVTDALNAGDKVTMIKFAEATDAVNVYPIAVLRNAAEPTLAQNFVSLVTSETGETILSQAGFGEP